VSKRSVMDKDIILHLEEVNSVASEYIKGKDESAIAKQLDIPRNRVVKLLNEWRSMVSNNEAIRGRAREALAGADQHYNHLIKRAYEVVEDADQTQNLGAKTNALKLILDIENKRIDMLQKAGLLENKELADQLLETERKQEMIMNVLKDIAATRPDIKNEIVRRLAEISGPTDEAVVIYDA
jgi:predicted metal-binding transcription factor (methanogenesis marker protein 9)